MRGKQHADDVPGIAARMRQADAVVFASPGFRMGALLPDGELAGSCGPRAAKAAEDLVRAVADGGALRPGFIPLMMFRIQQLAWQRGGDPASPDHEYWQSRGWLGSGCTFYVDHHAGPLTVGLARLVGTLVAGIYAS